MYNLKKALFAGLIVMGVVEAQELSLIAPSSNEASEGFLIYLAQRGEVARAIQGYRAHVAEVGEHDFDLLHRIALQIIRQGCQCPRPEGRLLALYSAGVAQDGELFDVIRAGLGSESPEIQIAAIHLLDALQTDQADELLVRTLSSDSLLVRLEASHCLVQKGHPEAVSHLLSTMVKVPPELHLVFTELYAMARDQEADSALRRLMAEGGVPVKCVAALSLAKNQRDDFLPEIRRIATRLDPFQQEAAAKALGELRDTASTRRLEELSASAEVSVRIAALEALYVLGHEEDAGFELRRLAVTGNLFAIAALAKVPSSSEELAHLLLHRDINTRTNAAISLLTHGDARALPVLAEILLSDSKDLGILPRPSLAGGVTAFEVIPCLEAKAKKQPELKEISNSIREAVLREAVELEEADFLRLAELIFATQQKDLIPLLVRLLENHATPAALQLLQRHREKAGAPLIRNYCNLALARATSGENYLDALRTFVKSQVHHPLIELRPLLPWSRRKEHRGDFTLTPAETSRLLIESYEVLAERQDAIAVEALLDGLEKGHPDNRAVLAALLIRTID